MADDGRSPRREVLDDGPVRRSSGERWSAMPPGRRRAVTAWAAVVLGGAAAAVGTQQTHQWLDERRLQDQVALRASIGVESWSSPLAGDRVDFYAILHNTGSRPVQVTAVHVSQPRLSIRNRSAPRRPIAAGESLRVPLSVILDCTDPRAPGQAGSVRGAVAASAANGRERSVSATFERAGLITDVADTLCRVRPGLRGAELSGPLGR